MKGNWIENRTFGMGDAGSARVYIILLFHDWISPIDNLLETQQNWGEGLRTRSDLAAC